MPEMANHLAARRLEAAGFDPAYIRRVLGVETEGHIFAFVTCDRVKWEQDDDGNPLEDPLEENGWISPRWSNYVLYDSRNDVYPVVDCDLADRETLEGEIKDALGVLEGGYEDNGDGTFYSSDRYTPYASVLDDRGDWSYSYALHFTRKYLGPDGYVEVPWHPVADGGFVL